MKFGQLVSTVATFAGLLSGIFAIGENEGYGYREHGRETRRYGGYGHDGYGYGHEGYGYGHEGYGYDQGYGYNDFNRKDGRSFRGGRGSGYFRFRRSDEGTKEVEKAEETKFGGHERRSFDGFDLDRRRNHDDYDYGYGYGYEGGYDNDYGYGYDRDRESRRSRRSRRSHHHRRHHYGRRHHRYY